MSHLSTEFLPQNPEDPSAVTAPPPPCQQEGIWALFDDQRGSRAAVRASDHKDFGFQGSAPPRASPAPLINQSIPALLSSLQPRELTEVSPLKKKINLGNCSKMFKLPAPFIL